MRRRGGFLAESVLDFLNAKTRRARRLRAFRTFGTRRRGGRKVAEVRGFS